MLKNLFKKFGKILAIDLGTTNILISEKDKGIIINEPAVVAINLKNDQILAVGHEARKMIGKTHQFIATYKPLHHGIISDFEVTEKMLKFFFNKINQSSLSLLARPTVIIGVPLDITEVEKKAVEDAVISAGASHIHLVHSVVATAIGARLPILDASGNMIVNIGGGITEIAVISLGGVVTWKSITTAGEELNKNIINYAREQFNLLLGEKIAEEIKMKIGSAENTNEDLQVEMRGRDLLSGLPKEVMINERQIREALLKSFKNILDNIKLSLENTPPELIADIYEKGIVLAGGGALLKGIDKIILKATEIPVRIVDDPLTCTIRGLSMLIEDEYLLRDVELSLSSDERKLR